MGNLVRMRGFAAGSAVLMALAACSGEAPADDENAEVAGTMDGSPDAKPGVALEGGQLVLPAVSGRPGAVYFTLTNGGDVPVTLVGAHVAGSANAEMHRSSESGMEAVEDIEIAAGESVQFTRGGLHVMAFELGDEVTDGGEAELTLTFSDGDKLSAPLTVVPMGEAMADHGGDH